MVKKVLIILMALSLIAVLGCVLTSKTTNAPGPANIKKVREAQINKAWSVKQMEIELEDEIPLTLILKNGDKVDGYFYVEKGDNIGFNVSGNSLIYTSKPPDAETKSITSDRFSFTASQAQGIAYILTLSTSANATGEHGKATVFMEIIYPSTGSLSIPYGTK
jgi:hypothetical protein